MDFLLCMPEDSRHRISSLRQKHRAREKVTPGSFEIRPRATRSCHEKVEDLDPMLDLDTGHLYEDPIAEKDDISCTTFSHVCRRSAAHRDKVRKL